MSPLRSASAPGFRRYPLNSSTSPAMNVLVADWKIPLSHQNTHALLADWYVPAAGA